MPPCPHAKGTTPPRRPVPRPNPEYGEGRRASPVRAYHVSEWMRWLELLERLNGGTASDGVYGVSQSDVPTADRARRAFRLPTTHASKDAPENFLSCVLACSWHGVVVAVMWHACQQTGLARSEVGGLL